MTPKEQAEKFIKIMDYLFEKYEDVEDIPPGIVVSVFDTAERMAKYIIESAE